MSFSEGKSAEIFHYLETSEGQPRFNSRNLVLIRSQGILEFCFRHRAQRASDHFSESNVRIKSVEVESSGGITLIEVSPTAPFPFVLPIDELGVEKLV